MKVTDLAKTELSDAGEEVDAYVESTSKMRAEIKALTGVDIMVDKNTFKDIYDIMDELSKVYDDLEDIEKASLTEILFGKLRANVGASILQNFDQAEKALATAQNSAGSAAREHERWMQSIAASEAQASASFEEFSSKVMSSDIIKFGYDAQTGILGFLTKLIDLTGSATPLVSALAAGLLSFKNVELLTVKASGQPGFKNNFGFLGSTINERAQSKTNVQFASAFDALMNQGNISNEDAITGALKNIGKTANDVSDDIIEAAKSAENGNLSFKAMADATKVASVGARMLSIALNTLGTLAITAAISLLVKVINDAVHAQERLEDELASSREEYESHKSAVEDLNKEIENTAKLIEQLENKGESKLSIVEKEELKNLKDTNVELERKLAIEEALLKIANQQKYDKAAEVYKGKNKETVAAFDHEFMKSAVIEDYASGTGKFSNIYSDDTTYLDRAKEGLGFAESADAAIIAYRIANEQFIKEQEAYKNALEDGNQDEADKIKERMDNWDQAKKDAQSYLSDMSKWYSDNTADLKWDHDATPGSSGAIVNQMLFEAGKVGLYAAETTGKNNAQYVNDLVKSIYADSFDEIEKYIAENGSIGASYLKKNFSDIIATYEQFGWSLKDVISQFNEDYSVPNVEKSGVADGVYASLLKNREGYSALTAAIEEQNEAGVLSYETYTALIEANAEFAEMLTLTADGYILNTEALNEYIEAQDELSRIEAIIELEKVNDQLANSADLSRDEIQELQNQKMAWEQLIMSINSANGALAEWNKAKASKNPDANFSEGESIYKTIKEGRKTGKIGTDDFESAVNFALGQGWETSEKYGGMTEKQAYKEAERISKRYYGQKDERQGMKNFRDDLIKAGLGSMEGNVFTLEDTATVEGMAEALGTSVDSIKTMLGLMKSYGADFEYKFDTSDLSEEDRKRVENAKSIEEIEAAQKEITAEIEKQQGILNSDTATEEQKQAAQEQVDSLTKANEVLEEKQEVLTGVEEATKALTLEEAITKINELKAAIDTLVDANIDVPVTLSGQYEALDNFIKTIGGETNKENGEVTGFSLKINGVDDAKSKIEAIQKAIDAIKNNPEINPQIAATLTGIGEDTIAALKGFIDSGANTCNIIIGANSDEAESEITNLENKVNQSNPQMNVGAETREAEDEINKVQYGSGNGYTVTLVTEAEDKATPTIEDIKNSEEGHTTTITADADINPADKKIQDYINQDRTITFTTKFMPDGEGPHDLGEGETIETKAKESGYVVESYGENKYVYKNAVDYFNKIVEEIAGLGKGITDKDVLNKFNKDKDAGLVAFDDTYGATIPELISSAIQNYLLKSSFNDSYGGLEETEPQKVEGEVDIDEAQVSEDLQEAVSSETPVVDATVNAPNAKEEIEEDLPENAEVSVETEVERPSPDFVGPMPSVEFNANVNATNAENEVSNLEDSIGAEASKPVILKAADAFAKARELHAEASKDAEKTVTIKTVEETDTFATGTKNAEGGRALVDERGAELIEHVSKGTYELGTNSGPRMTYLNPGDVVHTAPETRKILARVAKVGGFFRNGLNKGKAVIGKAFATGVSGSMDWSIIQAALSSSGSGSGGKQNSSSSKKNTSSNSWKKYVEKLFDWIEIRLARLETITNKWLLSASEAIGYMAKNKELDKALASVSKHIEEASLAYERYMEQADTIAKKTKLSSDIVEKIQNGTIDISSYSESTQEKIRAYQEWYDKAQALVDTIAELREQEREIATQKLDAILDHYQYRIDRLDAVIDKTQNSVDLKTATGVEIVAGDYDAAINATSQKVTELRNSRAALQAEFAEMIAKGYIKEGSEEWNNYTSELEELDAAIIESQIDLQELHDTVANLALTNLGYELAAIQNEASKISAMMSLHESQGSKHNPLDYDKLIENGMKQIENLEKQNEELRKQQSNLDKNSEKYQELESQIQSNNSAILDLKISQEEWNDSVIDLRIQELQEYQEELGKVNDKYQEQKELQQAIEDLERAKAQRTNKIYREGVGFVYESDQDAIREAQENLDQVVQDQLLGKIDDLIEALEDSKDDTNVYDANGNLLGTRYELPNIQSLNALLNGIGASDLLTGIVSGAGGTASEAAANAIERARNISVAIGDIVLQNVDNPNALAEDIVNQFSNALTQALNSKF